MTVCLSSSQKNVNESEVPNFRALVIKLSHKQYLLYSFVIPQVDVYIQGDLPSELHVEDGRATGSPDL